MERVTITRPFVGICHMQVCAESDVTDEEILAVCNRDNPSGTSNGWSQVHRRCDDKQGPVTCASNKARTHFLVSC